MNRAVALSASAWHGRRACFGAVRCGSRLAGSQVFSSVKGFNVDIGAWNTASVKDMSSVCALRPLRRANFSHDAAVARRKQSRRRCGSVCPGPVFQRSTLPCGAV